MGKFIDRTGKRYGMLVVLRLAEKQPGQNLRWVCRCDCGTVREVWGTYLTDSEVSNPNCGCDSNRRRGEGQQTHGMTYTAEYSLYHHAKATARKKNLLFNIELTDIVIPDVCPFLEIPLKREGPLAPNSPSLDKIVPRLGYVKGNVQVISFKANTMKHNATLEEFELMAKNWRVKVVGLW